MKTTKLQSEISQYSYLISFKLWNYCTILLQGFIVLEVCTFSNSDHFIYIQSQQGWKFVVISNNWNLYYQRLYFPMINPNLGCQEGPLSCRSFYKAQEQLLPPALPVVRWLLLDSNLRLIAYKPSAKLPPLYCQWSC